MKFRNFFGGLSTICVLVSLSSCDTKMYEDCPPDRIVDEWGVVDHTHTFGEYDSLYYVVNPIGNINDTTYYNGNYTDTYYHSDPVRVMLRYTADDSIQFNLDRLYATQTNPRNIVMTVEREDSVKKPAGCVLYLRRPEDNGNLYRTGADSTFKELLRSGDVLRIRATNGASSSEPSGSQNYEFRLYTSGFDKAFRMADSLNSLRREKAVPADSLKSSKDAKDVEGGKATAGK